MFLTEDQRHHLQAGSDQFGISLSARRIDQFSLFAELLADWNQRMNLTRVAAEDTVPLHFLDSLAVLAAVSVPAGARVIDVGTGAGFPGIPLKIARPDLAVTLLDSTRKRLRFLEEVIKELKLTGIEILHSRAEDAGRSTEHRERFDVATARAVAKTSLLAEWLLPFVKPGGFAVLLKSADIQTEIDESSDAIRKLGGKTERVAILKLPETEIERSIVVVAKVGRTPSNYPRSPAEVSKSRIADR